MKQTSKEAGAGERRNMDRRTPPAERREDVTRAATGERRVVENRGVGAAMVDALEDILQWERASERAIRVAKEAAGDAAAS
ncbi:MAG TPA: hypothetical protein VM925_11150 [Labilithrix sp.]|nr:hypothetical protein [Labilithrix sp.]